MAQRVSGNPFLQASAPRGREMRVSLATLGAGCFDLPVRAGGGECPRFRPFQTRPADNLRDERVPRIRPGIQPIRRGKVGIRVFVFRDARR